MKECSNRISLRDRLFETLRTTTVPLAVRTIQFSLTVPPLALRTFRTLAQAVLVNEFLEVELRSRVVTHTAVLSLAPYEQTCYPRSWPPEETIP